MSIYIVIDALLDGLKDTALSVPILFVTYLFMEILEGSQRMNEKVLCHYSRKVGPVIGGLLGVIPQCGISGAAATLYSTGTITLGTMLAVFFATSDEMLPVMLSSLTSQFSIGIGTIVMIMAGKAVLGVILGYITDVIVKISTGKNIHSFCEREHCECDEEEGSVFVAALVHTLKIAVMLLIVNIGLTLVIESIGIEALSGTILNQPIIGEILTGLFGLIPNCSISIILTESYLTGVLGIGGLFSGLLSNAGIGLIVLFRSNRSMKENFTIVGIMLLLSVISGIIINLIF
ncbi:MAG: putative manganese transporter [Firmicutes bacterium]|nr:putative manganese transporter [Bacillota bacterium]